MLNERNRDGNTALHIAAEHVLINTAKLLIEQGVDQGIKNNAHKKALDIAQEKLSLKKC